VIIISRITPPPKSEDNNAKQNKIREVIANNFPTELMSHSVAVIVNQEYGYRQEEGDDYCDLKIDDLHAEAKEAILSSIGQEEVLSFLSRYQLHVQSIVNETTGIKNKTRVGEILYYGFSYIVRINAQIEPDEDGVEPTDEELLRSYCSPLIPLDDTFIESIRSGKLPKEIKQYLEDILLFRKSVVYGEDSYLSDISYDELVNNYFSKAEREILELSNE